jgi:hypothetical protein
MLARYATTIAVPRSAPEVVPPAKHVGLWIDSHRAELVFITHDSIERKTIESNLEHRHRTTGGTRSATPYREYTLISEKVDQAARRQTLARFYNAIMRELAGADRFFIFGPGVTKHELKNRLIRNRNMRAAFEGTRSAEQLSENQLIESVREYFQGPSARRLPH